MKLFLVLIRHDEQVKTSILEYTGQSRCKKPHASALVATWVDHNRRRRGNLDVLILVDFRCKLDSEVVNTAICPILLVASLDDDLVEHFRSLHIGIDPLQFLVLHVSSRSLDACFERQGRSS